MEIPATNVDELVWPGIPNEVGSILMSLQFQLERSQWWSADTLLAHQFHQLQGLLKHAVETVPYYRTTLRESGIDVDAPLTAENWRKNPDPAQKSAAGKRQQSYSAKTSQNMAKRLRKRRQAPLVAK